MDMPCAVCKASALEAAEVEHQRAFGGRVYRARLPGLRCSACGAVLISDEALDGFEARLVAALARDTPSGRAFAFLRRSLGLRAAEVAALLRVPAEAIAQWEAEARPTDWMAFALVGQMALEATHGQHTTRQHLEGLRGAAASPHGDAVELGPVTAPAPTL